MAVGGQWILTGCYKSEKTPTTTAILLIETNHCSFCLVRIAKKWGKTLKAKYLVSLKIWKKYGGCKNTLFNIQKKENTSSMFA